MTAELGWFLLGLGLIIIEVMTGTFELLMFGIAAMAAAGVAWLGGPFWLQAMVAGAVAAGGFVFLRQRRASFQGAGGTEPIDVGQTATFEVWVSESDRLARVSYRGAPWEAFVDGEGVPAAGAMLRIVAVEGNRLRVASRSA